MAYLSSLRCRRAVAPLTRAGALLGLLTSAVLPARALSTGTFPAASPAYATGVYPVGGVVADFNGDGKPDVATANVSDNTVSVLLNSGAGAFPAVSPAYATGGAPIAIGAGDFNGDGRTDLVTVNTATNTLTVLLNAGGGAFPGPGAAYATGPKPLAIAVGDLSGDGLPDIVVANADGNTVSVLLNAGGGGFAAGITYAVGVQPIGVALADFNGDGRLDVAVSNFIGSSVSVLLNTGGGTFPATSPAYAVGTAPQGLATGDVTGDGHPDILAVNSSGNTVSVLVNGGAGSFPAASPAYAVGGNPSGIAVADIDGDGDLDAAVTNAGSASVSVLLNAGGGIFPSTSPAYAVGMNPATVRVADFNTDGAPDLAVTNAAGNSVSILLGTPIAPTITDFSPPTAIVGASVLLTGTGFTGATSVRFNGASAAFTVNSATSITATVPAGATSGPLSVTTSTGTATSAASFTVFSGPAPKITSFTPTTGVLGTNVTITGTGFGGTTDVRFNGISAPFTVSSATSIATTVPGGATTGKLSVTNPAGTATSGATFTVQVPRVTSFSPTAAATGASVTITGQYFSGATDVRFNGVSANFTVSSATSLTATVPAAAATGPVSVTTPTGTGTSSGNFRVLPVVSAFSPASGAPGTVVTITGSGFTGATAVKFYTVPATSFTVVSATTLQVTVPATALTGRLYVTTAGGTAASAASFTVAPIITGFSPGQGAPGSVVLVQGLNFTSATAVAFNGLNAVKTYNSPTQLTATVPAGATTGPLTVSNPAGTTTSAASFTVGSGTPPTITSFAPTTNVIAGTVITITGTNFTGATTVRFNNANATSFTINSATSITAPVPAGATTGRLYVTTPSGQGQSAASLTIVQPPKISSFSPAGGAVGSVVLIAGANLTNASSVTFNGVAATSYTVNSSAQIAAYVPAGATTGPLAVTTVAGTATSTASFTVTTAAPAPTITGITPTSGVRGATLTITGTNFTGVTSVKVGTVAATYSVGSPTQLTLTVPATATTNRVFVTAAGGMAQNAVFTVILSPTITGFSPASGAVGTTVTINGTNFTGATSVTFGPQATNSFTLVNASRLTVAVPAGAATGKLQVTNAAGTAVSANTFTVVIPRAASAGAGTEAEPIGVPLALYPNPAHEAVRVTATPGASAQLFDGQGRLVRVAALPTGTGRLDLRGLPAGLYSVRTGAGVQRLVVE